MATTTTTRKKMGRPPLNADERLVKVTARMRPGDVDKLVAAAHRRGIPTGSAARDWLSALLVILEHPGTVTRAGLEDLRVQLGLDEVAGGGEDPRVSARARSDHGDPGRGRAAAKGR
jgi:hypothetical protein